jgi:hypothetical protein
MNLRAAEAQLWDTPAECSPAEIPGLLAMSYRSLFPLASILRCLAATDLDAGRRANLTQIGGQLDQVLRALQPHCRARS